MYTYIYVNIDDVYYLVNYWSTMFLDKLIRIILESDSAEQKCVFHVFSIQLLYIHLLFRRRICVRVLNWRGIAIRFRKGLNAKNTCKTDTK